MALCALGGNAIAQDEADNDPIVGKASLGYLSTSGNTDSTNANAAFNLLWTPMLWSHEFDLSAIKADNSGVTTAEAYTATYTARRGFGEKSYLFAALDWQSDKFSAFDSQTSETVGYGRHVIAAERHSLDLEIGAGARQAELRDGSEEDDSIVRGALSYAWSISDTSEFKQGLIVETGSSNTRTESVSELRADIFGNLALALSYRLRNNSQVPPGIEKTDAFTAISLEYSF
jgi:putative salt-induced outer membrane protein